MDAEHEAHLQRVKDSLLKLVDEKYRAGQIEHGGKLWEKPGLLKEALKEVADLSVYLFTTVEQIQQLIEKYDIKELK